MKNKFSIVQFFDVGEAARVEAKAMSQMQYFKSADEEYGLPCGIPEGRVLAHNHVMHTFDMPDGENGFRCWTWPEGGQPEHFVPCPCGWAGLPHLSWLAATKGKCITDAQFKKMNGYTIEEAILYAVADAEVFDRVEAKEKAKRTKKAVTS